MIPIIFTRTKIQSRTFLRSFSLPDIPEMVKYYPDRKIKCLSWKQWLFHGFHGLCHLVDIIPCIVPCIKKFEKSWKINWWRLLWMPQNFRFRSLIFINIFLTDKKDCFSYLQYFVYVSIIWFCWFTNINIAYVQLLLWLIKWFYFSSLWWQ